MRTVRKLEIITAALNGIQNISWKIEPSSDDGKWKVDKELNYWRSSILRNSRDG